MLAGYETTATALTWALLEIARRPDVQSRLRREIRQKAREIEARGASGFTANDFDDMEYLTAVIKVSKDAIFQKCAFQFAPIAVLRPILPLLRAGPALLYLLPGSQPLLTSI